MKYKEKTLCVRSKVYSLSPPRVMGILNVTPDSFYPGSRASREEDIRCRVRGMVAAGADIIDIGGYSSRPGAEEVSVAEEWERLSRGIDIVRTEAPEIPVSVDTFRAVIARRALESGGADIINDISGGDLDPEIIDVVAEAGAPYVVMHMRGTPQTMARLTDYSDPVAEVFGALMEKVAAMHQKGVADVIIDPGFGFAKDVEQNYRLMAALPVFCRTDCPVLVGVSRKSMIWRPLGVTPEESLSGTIALNTAALLAGADIVRVHDVAEAVMMRDVTEMLKKEIAKEQIS